MTQGQLVSHSQYVASRGGSSTSCSITWTGGGAGISKVANLNSKVKARCLMECLLGYKLTRGQQELS